MREPKWYVLFVITGKEKYVYNELQKANIEAVMPRRKLRERKNGEFKEVERLLFPGYIFIKMVPNCFLTYCAIKRIYNVIRLLGDRNGPRPIIEEEVTYILSIAQGGNALDISKAYKENGVVHIVSGPLKGMEGKIINVDARRHRAKVRIDILGQIRKIELGIDVLEIEQDAKVGSELYV